MSKLNFDKEIEAGKPYLSISQVLDFLGKPFDKVGVAQKTHDKHFNDEDSQYYQKSVEEIIDMWEAKGAESCRYGSLLDDYIGCILTDTSDALEIYKLDNNYDYDERLHGLCDSFDNVYSTIMKSGDMEFVDREQTLYLDCGEFYIKGRFDALWKNNKTGKWIIIDWKSSGTIDKNNKWEKMMGPANKLDACNYNRYTLQLHFYKKALLESGYLPEETTEDDIEVLIIHMPGTIVESTGQNYQICKQAFPYDAKLMDQIFTFAYRKNMLLNKS